MQGIFNSGPSGCHNKDRDCCYKITVELEFKKKRLDMTYFSAERAFPVTQVPSIFCFRYNKISGLLGVLPRVLCENVADSVQRVV